ncbi:DUF1707 domain-containing protein [Amycolatopsis acidiphila]|uniref:DUF1707 domain-containing protein n=1 Tax=Amycolatopsis acidiphila TaxID=715473 RepID=A0A557ZQJ3_9PSEU|nr:DUF1707 domain-containing protein [Amycolatopsis acidiphila]TVT14297.1 DUF1707 domain-containing protein [Amycolatopsis acidiphila]UIJ64208.1 DUF1707 domain-containing protein [Amycolatopsis acidiphila]GHG94293.1 hypothetical protein GCM10017788_72160 [Amycolatopsis acidiphila]
MRASNDDRERVAQILHNALSEGRITVAELEQRLDTVYAAKTLAELEPPIADLPGVTLSGALQPAQPRAVDTRIGGIPGSQNSIAVMSGASRKGNWVVPPNHNSFAFWGGVDMDLRNARFAERHSTITAVAIMGGIDIIVPDDVVVDVNGIGFMGAFETEDRNGASAIPPPGAPVLKITGFAFWGAVTVIRKPREQQPHLPGGRAA